MALIFILSFKKFPKYRILGWRIWVVNSFLGRVVFDKNLSGTKLLEKNMEALLIIIMIALIILWVKNSKLKRARIEVEKSYYIIAKENEYYKKDIESLKKYEKIRDAELELERLITQMEDVILKSTQEAESLKKSATEESESLKKEARFAAKELRAKADLVLEEAYNLAARIELDAKQRAEDIAGEAWEAKQNADQYSETVKAMKNIIKGYGDEYLIPNHSLLDELAEEYSHKEAGHELAQIRTLIKAMIKNGEAADCDYAESHRKSTAIEFVLDAFNGKVDTIMAKVKHDNYGKLLQELKDAYRLVNHNGKPFRDARITPRYFDVVEKQLKIAVVVQELKKQDLEEQRQIREAMREEEKVQRDIEKALRESEKEERMLEKALKEAESKLSQAAADERAKFEEELAQIKQRLLEAEERGQRAQSMAQQTKRGHVYIISNIGSFGENVLKIGLTRRLEPMDRIKELGDASVPFSFDVHAMIHSEDAPQLEKELHDKFELHRVNKVNYRKEFFSIPISEIKSKIDEMGFEAHWTMKAEAQEYRESVELRRRELELVGSN